MNVGVGILIMRVVEMNWKICIILFACIAAAMPAYAAITDTSAAEKAYKSGDYMAARQGFESAAESFKSASKDSSNYLVYREAAYIYDRLADCCFTQRDWESMKAYLDGLLVVSVSERNLCESQLAGALESGIAYATAKHLSDQLDESVRLSTIFQLKRSLGLVLFDSKGAGAGAEQAIKLYQELAAAIRGPLYLDNGNYLLDLPELESNYAKFDKIFEDLEGLGDIDSLWQQYPPQSPGAVDSGSS